MKTSEPGTALSKEAMLASRHKTSVKLRDAATQSSVPKTVLYKTVMCKTGIVENVHLGPAVTLLMVKLTNALVCLPKSLEK